MRLQRAVKPPVFLQLDNDYLGSITDWQGMYIPTGIPGKGSSVMTDDAKYKLCGGIMTTGAIINQQTTMHINQPESNCYAYIERLDSLWE